MLLEGNALACEHFGWMRGWNLKRRLLWHRTGIKASKTYRVYSNAFMEGRPQGDTGPRNYLRPGIPSIQPGAGGPPSSHIPDRRVSSAVEWPAPVCQQSSAGNSQGNL